MTARTYDLNGWFEVDRNPISREGIFPYSGAQIGAPDPDRIYRVYRPADELSDPEAMASFRLCPIVDDHTMLGEGATPAENKGVAGVIGEKLTFEGGVLLANLKFFSNALAEKIKNGKTELSCGYRCVYDFTPGVWRGQEYDVVQRQIRGNHLALVDEGRMGPEVAVLDHMVFTVDAKETTVVDEELKELLAVLNARLDKIEARLDEGKEEETTAEAEGEDEDKDAPPAKAKDEDTPPEDKDAPPAKVSDEDADKPAAKDEDKDAPPAKAKDADEDKPKDPPAMDEAAIMGIIARKSALASRLAAHVGTFDHAAMTHSQVVAYGVKKLGLKNIPAGQEAVALDAALQVRPLPTARAAADSAPKSTALGKRLAEYAGR